MNGWREAMGVDAKDITFLVDDLGEVSASWNLAKDYSGASLGVRSERFSMLVEDGEVAEAGSGYAPKLEGDFGFAEASAGDGASSASGDEFDGGKDGNSEKKASRSGARRAVWRM